MGSSTSKGNISTFMLVVSLLAILVIAVVITELMLTDGVRAGRYNNPNVASKVVRGTIYDRNGHQVYHRRNIATDDDWWDPAARRHPGGTYFYYFKAHGVTIHTQHTGVIEVLRDK